MPGDPCISTVKGNLPCVFEPEITGMYPFVFKFHMVLHELNI